MNINAIREYSGLDRNAFCAKYNIPYRTLQNWELGERECPDYVTDLLERAVKVDFMKKYILIDTVNGDSFNEAYATAEQAIKGAIRKWENLGHTDQTHRTEFCVIESANPDEEAENHYDGEILWNGLKWYNGEDTRAAVLKIYDDLDLNYASIESDDAKNYLTVNTCRNGRDVVWYDDGNKAMCIYIDTYEKLTLEEIEEELE